MSTALATESVLEMIKRVRKTEVSPADITPKVLDAIGTDYDSLLSAVQEILPTYVQTCVASLNASAQKAPSVKPILPTPSPGHKYSDKKRKTPSFAVDAISKWYEDFSQTTVFLTGSKWKRMVDCTPEDFEIAASRCESRAASSLAKALKFRATKDKLVESGVQSIAALSVSELATIWEDDK